MSLRGFHVVFITCSVILALGFAGWGMQSFWASGYTLFLLWGMLGLVCAIALVIYEYFFLRKTKSLK